MGRRLHAEIWALRSEFGDSGTPAEKWLESICGDCEEKVDDSEVSEAV